MTGSAKQREAGCHNTAYACGGGDGTLLGSAGDERLDGRVSNDTINDHGVVIMVNLSTARIGEDPLPCPNPMGWNWTCPETVALAAGPVVISGRDAQVSPPDQSQGSDPVDLSSKEGAGRIYGRASTSPDIVVGACPGFQ